MTLLACHDIAQTVLSISLHVVYVVCTTVTKTVQYCAVACTTIDTHTDSWGASSIWDPPRAARTGHGGGYTPRFEARGVGKLSLIAFYSWINIAGPVEVARTPFLRGPPPISSENLIDSFCRLRQQRDATVISAQVQVLGE